MPRPISSAIVVGGGIVGWSAAAALRRRLPKLDVTVVPVPPPADALADRIGCTLPSIVEFNSDLGLTEADAVARAGSGYRLGTRFEGWAEGLPDYVHAYGEYGRPLGTGAFHQHWVRAAKADQAPEFDAFSPAARIAAAERFVHPQSEEQSPLATYAYGLHIDPPRYGEMMRAYALHLGAAEGAAGVRDIRLRASDGFVEAALLDDGSEIAADLFIDASGPQSLVRGRLDEEWEDWSKWLPADRILLATTGNAREPSPLDRSSAISAGWQWQALSPAGTSHGVVYSSAHLSDSEAERVLRNATSKEPGEPSLSVRAGRRPQPWLRNCVAIGDSAVAVEPLEWTNLHLAHSAIDRIVAMMPDADCSEVELWDYNRQVAMEADRVRDFLVLHYATARRRDEPFWKEIAARTLPQSLEHTLNQFRERGRLPFYEEETFSRDSWLAVLLGQGVIPRRVDPLIDIASESESERAMAQLRQSLDELVQTLPAYADYLRNIYRQAAR